MPEKGSQKGDVYSFALIVQEIVSRQGVFYLGNDEKTPKGKLLFLNFKFFISSSVDYYSDFLV
jgi:hypothetical protein